MYLTVDCIPVAHSSSSAYGVFHVQSACSLACFPAIWHNKPTNWMSTTERSEERRVVYWRPGENNVGDYVSKHHSPAHHQTMRPKTFVNLVCQNPFSSTENCLQRLSICLQRGCDNPTIVGYDSNCSHKPHGTSKPTLSSPKGYLPSFTSISKI